MVLQPLPFFQVQVEHQEKDRFGEVKKTHLDEA
jgi:hypothetical protein